MIGRRGLVAGAALLAAHWSAGRPAGAVRVTPGIRHMSMLIGAALGTGLDASARAFAPLFAHSLLGTEVTPRNIPGDQGMSAIHALIAAPPNGLTLGWMTSPTLSARMVDHSGDEPLLPRLRLLGAVEREPVAFVCPAAAPLESVQDLIQRSSTDQDAVPLGTPPPGSPPHLAALRLQVVAQTRLSIIAFPSAAAARQAVIAGNVAAAALALSDVFAALRDEKLVGIGIAARKRSEALPDVPVLQEAGVPLSVTIRRGLVAPAGLSDEMAAHLTEAMRTIVADPEFRALGDASGFLPAWMDGPAWTAQVDKERGDLAKLWATDPWLPSNGG